MRNAMRRTGSRSSFSNSSSPLTLPSVTSRSESPAPLPDRKGGRTGPLHLVYHGKGKGRTLSIVGATTGRIYSGHALCGLLAPDNPVRLCAIWLCEQPVFDNTVLFVIIVNSAFLAVSPPTGGGPINEVWSHMLELWFTILFTIELSIKVLAMGFAGREGTYLADGWNRLDCTVVLLGWAPYIFPSLANLSAIRSLRALRPLRTINQLPGLRRQARTLFDSLPKLSDVAMLGVFMLALFGVLGLQLFKGALRSRCYALSPPPPPAPLLHLVNGVPIDVPAPSPPTAAVAAQQAFLDASALGSRARMAAPVGVAPLDEDDFVCNDGGVPGAQGTCEPGEVCLYYGHNPAYGTESFDSITAACMTIFQCVTLEGWVDVMCARRPLHCVTHWKCELRAPPPAARVPRLCLSRRPQHTPPSAHTALCTHRPQPSAHTALSASCTALILCAHSPDAACLMVEVP